MATWISDEVRLAVENGYPIIDVYEVSQYDRTTGEGGLLLHYIKTFLKLNAEASGYPNCVHCPEDKDYVRNLYE
jgi:hypothetical protein